MLPEKVKAVVSYEDDVFAWVYLDQTDRVIRYEAYIVDYDDNGEKSTLKFVLEEGVLDNMHEVPIFAQLLTEYYALHPLAKAPLLYSYRFTHDGHLVSTSPLLFFYSSLSADKMAAINSYFSAQEERLKREKKGHWLHILHALGFDVVEDLT